MRTLQEIQAAYNAADAECEARCKAIKKEAGKKKEAAMRYQRIAAKKMGEYHKLYSQSISEDNVHWTEHLLLPLLLEVEERTGVSFREEDKRDFHCFGLRCECHVFIKGEPDEQGESKTLVYLCFTPGGGYNEPTYLCIDTGKKREDYHCHPDSIAAMNGFDKETVKVESVEQIIELIRNQAPELITL